MKPRAKPPSQPGAGNPQQLERELRRACSWVKTMKEICEYFFPAVPCRPYVYVALKTYRELVFTRFDESNVESIKRVIDACNENKLLVDFAPRLYGLIEKLNKTAEERGDEEIIELARQLEKMTLADFLKNWEDIMDMLDYEYRVEAMELYEAVVLDNVLVTVLEEGIRRVAASRGIGLKEAFSQLEY